MIKILSTAQISEIDKRTILEKPISSSDLMLSAARACVDKLFELYGLPKKVLILCGPGNNGGDGLAIACLLAIKNVKVCCVLIASEKYSEDNSFYQKECQKIQAEKLNSFRFIHAQNINFSAYFNDDYDYVIDALFGNGLKKPLGGHYEELVKLINASKYPLIAIDTPSGLFAESAMPDKSIAVKASHTLSFHFPKLSFLFVEGYYFTGYWHLLNIGLLSSVVHEQACKYFLMNAEAISSMLKSRAKFSHKGVFGHALLFAGSNTMPGAAVIAAKACLRSGVGKLSCYSTSDVLKVVNYSTPECMNIVSANEKYISGLPDTFNFDAIGIGPGIGKADETIQSLKLLIQQYRGKLVVDADAINILADNPTWLSFLPSHTILTPHLGELTRLVGKCENSFDTLEKAKAFSFKYNCILLVKSANSYLITPAGNVYFNSTGNPGMATGGSGDALTGIILGLLSCGYEPIQAALISMFTHGLAADLALENQSVESLLPYDVIENLGKAFNAMRSIS